MQFRNNDVLATFEQHGAVLDAVLSDDGREFRGREDQYAYEPFLQLEGIAHKRTRVSRPRSNGIVERLHRALLHEHFRVEVRKTGFATMEEMQSVLNACLSSASTRSVRTRAEAWQGAAPGKAFVQGIIAPSRKERIAAIQTAA